MGDTADDIVLSGRDRLIYYNGRLPRKMLQAKQSKDERVDVDALEWSDDESDWMPKSPERPQPKNYDSRLTDQPSTIHPDVKKDDHKRRGVTGLAGDVQVETRRLKPLLEREEKKPSYDSFRLPMPYIPSHVKESLGQEIADHLWHEFLEYGADESELVQISKLKKIGAKVERHLGGGYMLHFDRLKFNGLDRNDFVSYNEVCTQLASLAEKGNTTVKMPKKAEPKIPLPHCASEYCRLGDEGLVPVGDHKQHFAQMAEQEGQDKDAVDIGHEDEKGPDNKRQQQQQHSGAAHAEEKDKNRVETVADGDGDGQDHEDGEEDDDDDDDPSLYALGLAYQHLRAKLQGFVRLKHVPQLMETAKLPYDKSRYPSKEWDLRGEFVMHSQKDMEAVAQKIRTDKDDDRKGDEDTMYALPKWMENEFKPSEIMLFKHQFMSIDVDGGGELDEEELQTLTESLGARVSIEEARGLIEAMDLDGGGTVSFDEFMMLMYKIQNNVIDLEGNMLAKSMVAAKSQLGIFEEIEENLSNPTAGTKIMHYGGQPVCCDILIEGPEGSLYEGSNMQLRIVFQDGYPYRMPDIFFHTRLYHLNVLVQYDGQGSLPHMKYFWDSSWNIKKILSHVINLLINPDLSMVPVEYITIVKVFLKERLDSAQTADNERRAQLLFEKDEARQAERERLAAVAEQEEEDRQEEERRLKEGRLMAGEDDIDDNLAEIQDMEQHDINTIEADEKRSYKLKELKRDWAEKEESGDWTDAEKQDLAEQIDANEDPDWEEAEAIRIEKEERQINWNNAVAMLLWEIENAKYEAIMMGEEDLLSDDIRDEENTMAGTDPLLLLLKTLIGDDDGSSAAQGATSDELMEKIGRVEQMHLTTIQMFMFERPRYEGVVSMYKERFGRTYDPNDGDGEEDGESKSDLKSVATAGGAESKAGAVLTEAELDAQLLAEEKQQAKDDAFFDAKGDSDSESEESVDLTLQFD
jgi:ubiquitin-conjugating enzyme E2 D/E